MNYIWYRQKTFFWVSVYGLQDRSAVGYMCLISSFAASVQQHNFFLEFSSYQIQTRSPVWLDWEVRGWSTVGIAIRFPCGQWTPHVRLRTHGLTRGHIIASFPVNWTNIIFFCHNWLHVVISWSTEGHMFLRMCSLCSLLNLGSGTRAFMSVFSVSWVFLVKNCFPQYDWDDVQGYCKSVLD